MSVLRRLCKLYGSMTINGVKWVWDYAANEPVEANKMKPGSARAKASERKRWSDLLADRNAAALSEKAEP